MRKIRAEIENRGYSILIGPGLLEQTGRWLKEVCPGDRLVIITNPAVQGLCGGRLSESLSGAGFQVTVLIVPDGEEYKSLDSAGRLYTELTDAYAERSTPILALGGGVIGDLAGFVAATYLRSVPLVQLPTTLLAQVDSSIGGKVAVNHGQLKNKIGAFYQPRLVISDTTLLKTLPEDEFTNGMAEVVKSAVIRDEDFFSFLASNLKKIKQRDDDVLEEVVFRTAGIKADVVAGDEFDLGLRNILNFGHTIGHAIETSTDFRVAHGQAVSAGMVAAARIARELGVLGAGELAKLTGLLETIGLPITIKGLESDKIIEAMKHDKKIVDGKIRFVLPRAIGDVFVTEEVSLTLVLKAMGG
jgi:3-dehydroquinate synthase